MKDKIAKFKMRHAYNGYILEGPEGEILHQTSDFNEDSDLEKFIHFLYDIIEVYGPEQSRYGHKLRINWVPGDKNDDGWNSLKECPLCYQEIKDV